MSFVIWLDHFVRLANNVYDVDSVVWDATAMFCTFAAHFARNVVIWTVEIINTKRLSKAIRGWLGKRVLVILQDWSVVS